MVTQFRCVIPEEFMQGINDGSIVRTGAQLRNASSGSLAGFLKVVGPMDSQAQMISELLGLNVSAASSVATLGVSAAGFEMVIDRLKCIESKLDLVANEIRSVHELLKKMDFKWDMLTVGKLISASERLMTAEHTEGENRKILLLNEANSEFSKLRGYLFSLISQLRPAFNADLNIEEVRDLLSRYFTAAIGQLHSEFLLNDLGAYRKTLNFISDQSKEITGFDVLEVFRARSDSRPPLELNFDHKQLMGEVKSLKSYVTETVDRIHSYNVELDFIEQNNISTDDYLEFLRNQEPGIVLIPATTGH